MRILLTNDDGINSPGIAAMHAKLDGLGEIISVAPMNILPVAESTVVVP